MAKMYPYLAFENAKEALGYYEEVFGATNISRLPVSEEQSEMFGLAKENLENTTVHGGFTLPSLAQTYFVQIHSAKK